MVLLESRQCDRVVKSIAEQVPTAVGDRQPPPKMQCGHFLVLVCMQTSKQKVLTVFQATYSFTSEMLLPAIYTEH